MPPTKLRVGLCGGGMGGLAAAIAIARGGAKVTLLEAAQELGEIGAGIQMFPNVSRFLIRWGVDEVIGDDLIAVNEINTWGADGGLISHFDTKVTARNTGFPHWVVRRDHLHAGLTESARRHGVELLVASRVQSFDDSGCTVKVITTSGKKYEFDLLIGSDGIKSTIRQALFPNVQLHAASKVAAFRGILTYEEVFAKVPEARTLLRNTADSWIGPNGYILLYPLTAGRELNVVTLFQMDHVVQTPEEAQIEEFRSLYKYWPPIARKILELVNYTQKWPLLVLPPMKTWSNEKKNVVLLGDAAHCMQNHMAQGAATAMEDGAFLGRVLSEVVRGVITIPEAISIYEKQRIPRAWIKQQVSFVAGTLNMAMGDDIARRNKASIPELQAWNNDVIQPMSRLAPSYRSWKMVASAESVPGILNYDAECDADNAVCEYLQSTTEMDSETLVTKGLWDKWWGVVDFNGIDSSAAPNGIDPSAAT